MMVGIVLVIILATLVPLLQITSSLGMSEEPRKESDGPTRRTRGFTLIEIMAVVLIIGLLTTIVGTAVFQQIDKGRVTATQGADQAASRRALEFYRMDNARFPTTEQGLEALVTAASSEPEPRNSRPGGYLQGGRAPGGSRGASPTSTRRPGQHNPALLRPLVLRRRRQRRAATAPTPTSATGPKRRRRRD